MQQVVLEHFKEPKNVLTPSLAILTVSWDADNLPHSYGNTLDLSWYRCNPPPATLWGDYPSFEHARRIQEKSWHSLHVLLDHFFWLPKFHFFCWCMLRVSPRTRQVVVGAEGEATESCSWSERKHHITGPSLVFWEETTVDGLYVVHQKDILSLLQDSSRNINEDIEILSDVEMKNVIFIVCRAVILL